MIQGVRVGLVRRTRFGPSCQDAVARVFDALPPTPGKRLLVVDAGIATKEQFAAATEQDALLDQRGHSRRKLRFRPSMKGNVSQSGCEIRRGMIIEIRIFNENHHI